MCQLNIFTPVYDSNTFTNKTFSIMKTIFVLALLIVLSPLGIHAQEDTAPNYLLASVSFHDTDPPITSKGDFKASTTTEWLSQPPSSTLLYEKEENRTPLNSIFDFQRNTLTAAAVSNVARKESSPAVSELDYSKLHRVVDYDYFLEDGGLRLRLFR